ncbi:MAG: MdtA/MuxA family multidrug efflux RND transporter periplasmic adaptor subunit [Candidatus Acidiferrum sp.]
MGHLDSIDLPEQGARDSAAAPPAKSRWWLWIVVLGVIAIGIWYFRGARSTSEAGGKAAAGASGQGRRGAGAGNFTVPVVVATAQKGDLPVYLIGLGTVTAYNTVTVRSRVDGAIVKVNFTEGQFVHQGDALIEIDPRPYQVMLEQAEGQLAKDQAQLHDVQVDFERYQLLYSEDVIPKQQVDTQQAQVGQYLGAIKADQATIDNAKLQLVYSHITAPISGRVGLRLVDMGNIVHATDTTGLLVITQLQPISVIFTLPQDQLQQVLVKLRGGGQLPVEAYDRDDTTRIAEGKLATIDNQIDPTTGTYKLKSIFSNENNALFPNQFVNVHMLVDIKHNLVIVPAAAIQRGPQGTYVYAISDGDTAHIRPVTVAQTTGNNIGVSSGLQGGDVVVIDGADKLQDGSKVIATAAPASNTQGTAARPSTQTASRPGHPTRSQSSGEKAR